MLSIFYDKLVCYKSQGKKMLALLIDPDKYTDTGLANLLADANKTPGPDLILVGGSLVFNGIGTIVEKIKHQTHLPVFLFPGSAMQVAPMADGILLLSLISGRNPDFLIGHHVMAAPALVKAGIEVIPTGYILVDGGTSTSVSYMSNTIPIPSNKTDIALATSMAGQLLGLKQIYLEAGSGAKYPVQANMVKAVSQQLNIPVWVGGGIRNTETLLTMLHNGADMVVVGTAFEANPDQLRSFCNTIQVFNQAL
jgi:phosphoglycerol geranylgeranyltransferase